MSRRREDRGPRRCASQRRPMIRRRGGGEARGPQPRPAALVASRSDPRIRPYNPASPRVQAMGEGVVSRSRRSSDCDLVIETLLYLRLLRRGRARHWRAATARARRLRLLPAGTTRRADRLPIARGGLRRGSDRPPRRRQWMPPAARPEASCSGSRRALLRLPGRRLRPIDYRTDRVPKALRCRPATRTRHAGRARVRPAGQRRWSPARHPGSGRRSPTRSPGSASTWRCSRAQRSACARRPRACERPTG